MAPLRSCWDKSMQVESQLNQGSTFRVMLTLPATQRQQQHHDKLVGGRIMCLDNDPDELHRMQELFASFGMQVETFRSAQDPKAQKDD